MRGRWQIVSRMWDSNKTAANRLSLLGQLDYYGKLTSQIEWQLDHGGMPLRVIYSSAGVATAAIASDATQIVDYKLVLGSLSNGA